MLRETVGCLLPSFGLNSRTIGQQLRQGLTRGAWSLQPSGSVGPEPSHFATMMVASHYAVQRPVCITSSILAFLELGPFCLHLPSLFCDYRRSVCVRVCVCAYKKYIYILCVCNYEVCATVDNFEIACFSVLQQTVPVSGHVPLGSGSGTALLANHGTFYDCV